MDGGPGRRDRQKYEIYMEATMLDRIADSNYRAKAELNTMSAEVSSEVEKHHALVKEMKVRSAGKSLHQLCTMSYQDLQYTAIM